MNPQQGCHTSGRQGAHVKPWKEIRMAVKSKGRYTQPHFRKGKQTAFVNIMAQRKSLGASGSEGDRHTQKPCLELP